MTRVAIALAALAGCAERALVSTTRAGEAAADTSSAAGMADSTAAADDQRTATAPGQWFTRTNPEGRWAGFGPPYSEAVFSVRCEGGRLIFNAADMPPTGPGPTEMTLTAAGVSRTLSAEASDEGLPVTDASVPANEDWLALLAAASGNLTVTVGGGEPVVVPIGEPMTSLIRDCRR